MTTDQISKTIDWELGIQLAGGNEALAKEMLTLLVKELPETAQLIAHAHSNQDFSELQRLVHKLHGGTCYCGVPRLKAAAAQLDSHLQSGHDDETMDLVQHLQYAIEAVLQESANGEAKIS